MINSDSKLISKKPLLIYDGDCSFCRYWVDRWKFSIGNQAQFSPFQDVHSHFPDLSISDFQKSVWLIDNFGNRFAGAEAVFHLLSQTSWIRIFLPLYRFFPPFRFMSNFFYRYVADHRSFFFALTKFLFGYKFQPVSFEFSSWLFVRLLALVYFSAFFSLYSQILGLIGHQGILPAGNFLNFISSKVGMERFLWVPSLFWLNSTDAVLKTVCALGAVLSILTLSGLIPFILLFLNWVLYLSLVTVGGDFLRFQWDALLLEVGFLALFIVPRGKQSWKSPLQFKPPAIILFMFRWLLFRLMFSSGLVKLLSDDISWKQLTALRYHYETQPLPTWIGWYAHQLSAGAQKYSAIAMFVIELIVPIFIFAPRRLRHGASVILIIFQIIIALTGNFGFFNYLTMALCVLLFDDTMWLFKKLKNRISNFQGNNLRPVPQIILVVVSIVLFIGSLQALPQKRRGSFSSSISTYFHQTLASFRVVNNYGLFAVMTTVRPEIIIQGSDDGKTWLTYKFKYKPEQLNERPRFIAPHQPRLDWQMWFAALGTLQSNSWFRNLCFQLLNGSLPVLDLLAQNPFPGKPPAFIRALLCEYRFTSLEEKSTSGEWWKMEEKGFYCPPVALNEKKNN